MGHCHKSAAIKVSEYTETDSRHQLEMSTGIGGDVRKYDHTATLPPCFGSTCIQFRLPLPLESSFDEVTQWGVRGVDQESFLSEL